MRTFKIYDGTKTYMYPNGAIAKKETVLADFPAVLEFPHIIEVDSRDQVMLSCQNLSMMRDLYNIDQSLTDEEAVIAIQNKINEPVATTAAASPEERIAAALEYQNLMAMPDAGGTV